MFQWCCSLGKAGLLPTCSYSSVVYNVTELLSSTPKQLLGSMEAGGKSIRNIEKFGFCDIWHHNVRYPAASTPFVTEDRWMPQVLPASNTFQRNNSFIISLLICTVHFLNISIPNDLKKKQNKKCLREVGKEKCKHKSREKKYFLLEWG